MNNVIRPALSLFICLTLITGLIYPLLTTGISQLIFPHQANGSLILKGDQAIGSELIGQQFSSPQFFWGRPSATSPAYNPAASSGSNLGPINPASIEQIQARLTALQAAHTGSNQPVPIDLVTSSGSGLDPEISIAAAYYQIPRVAQARQQNESDIKKIVDTVANKPLLGFWGEPRVNVLKLNLALEGK